MNWFDIMVESGEYVVRLFDRSCECRPASKVLKRLSGGMSDVCLQSMKQDNINENLSRNERNES